jgi:voltage-gated potassium channel
MQTHTEENKLGFLNLLVFVLSIYVLVALSIDTIFKLPPEISKLLYYIDNTICAVFFYDFCVRFYNAKDKLRFMRWGWIDLLSSIPAIQCLRAGRAVRLIRVLRIIRAFRSTKHFLDHIFHNRAQGTLTTVSIIAILIVVFSSISILQVEKAPNSNIKTAEDAIWWSYVTITTVGYGDKYPVTTEGRLIAVVLMTAGVGLFGTFTAYVSSLFVTDKRNKDKIEKDENKEL